jgi:hypothetical protein
MRLRRREFITVLGVLSVSDRKSDNFARAGVHNRGFGVRCWGKEADEKCSTAAF